MARQNVLSLLIFLLSFPGLSSRFVTAAATGVREYAVEVSAEVHESPPRIDFSWTADPTADRYYVYKKLVSQTEWTGMTILEGSATSYSDSSVQMGQAYEYAFLKTLDFHHHSIPAADGTAVTFTIYDQWGDGMCCHRGFGAYEVTGNSEVYASGGEFGAQESTSFIVGELGGPCNELTVNITIDVFGYETTWRLTENATGAILGQGGPYDSPHFGHICTGIRIPAVEDRGAVLLIIEGSAAVDLSSEINRLVLDLIGDGYRVVRRVTGPADDVPRLKAWIASRCAEDAAIDTVLLLGHVPVPYSGNVQGAHADHHGAWPADVYYAELNGEWTDETVNNTSASREENRNVPGDGKFDQTFLPSDADLQIGRVDLSRLTAFEPLTEVDLLRRYLEKNHAWRQGVIDAEPRGLIDDNVDDLWGLAPAATGWRNFSTMFGAGGIHQGDFFPDLTLSSYLWSYGCGGSNYTYCGGVGGTADFAANRVLSVFTSLYGSYFGDWDNENNVLRAPLAADGYTLTNFYSGRPVWNFHHAALGWPLGYSARLNQNNIHHYTVADGGRQIHIALMGDPTLKMYVVKPVSDLEVSRIPTDEIRITWTASEDQVQGYHIYRSGGVYEPFERINETPVTGTEYSDDDPLPGPNVYMVRALKLQTSASGTFHNLSCGVIGSTGVLSHVVVGPGPAAGNSPTVRVFPPIDGAGHEYQFTPYGAAGYGVNVTCGDVNGDGIDEIITGAGPGRMYGPHVRGFTMDGIPLDGLSYLAYGTHRYGVNVAAGDLDGDGYDEIITGAGPGAVFGPHVRGWDFDGGGSTTAIHDINYFAYRTPKKGVNISAGDIDGDGYDEIVTGAGPGAAYGPHVRGWNFDGAGIESISEGNFLAYGTFRYGVYVSCGDVDGDGIDEIVTGAGPGAGFGPHVRGWNFDGTAVVQLPGFSFFAWQWPAVRFGARLYGDADLDGDGRDEIVIGPGPDPRVHIPVRVFRYSGSDVAMWFSLDAFPDETFTHGATVAAGRH